MKLMVDRQTNKVLFVESDEAFVDILFSFLTLPVGAVCRLRHRRRQSQPQTPLGCMDNLFAGLMNLDPKYFKNPELKLILSSPRRSFLARYWSFVRTVEPAQVKKYCLCGSRVSQRNKVCGDNKLAACMCGIPNYCRCDRCPKVDNREENGDGLLFLRRGRPAGLGRQFIVTDDLKLAPVHSAASVLSALQDMGVRLTNNVQEVTVSVDYRDKLFNLLVRSLLSSSPLSDAFCSSETQVKAIPDVSQQVRMINNAVSANLAAPVPAPATRRRRSVGVTFKDEVEENGIRDEEEEEEEEGEERKPRKPARDFPYKPKETGITVNLVVDMACRRVLFAEAGEDFVDLLFNFLTYPLGSLALLADGGHPLKCLRHLWASLSDLDADKFFKSERCKQQLLFPDLPHQFYQSLLTSDPEEVLFSRRSSMSSKSLLLPSKNNSNKSLSPKESSVKNGVLKDCSVFMVTDDLVVTPLSSMAVISMLQDLNCYPKDVHECKVVLDLNKIRALLLASLTTTTALSSTFFPDDDGNDRAITLVE